MCRGLCPFFRLTPLSLTSNRTMVPIGSTIIHGFLFFPIWLIQVTGACTACHSSQLPLSVLHFLIKCSNLPFIIFLLCERFLLLVRWFLWNFSSFTNIYCGSTTFLSKVFPLLDLIPTIFHREIYFPITATTTNIYDVHIPIYIYSCLHKVHIQCDTGRELSA